MRRLILQASQVGVKFRNRIALRLGYLRRRLSGRPLGDQLLDSRPEVIGAQVAVAPPSPAIASRRGSGASGGSAPLIVSRLPMCVSGHAKTRRRPCSLIVLPGLPKGFLSPLHRPGKELVRLDNDARDPRQTLSRTVGGGSRPASGTRGRDTMSGH
jgi:hypothetical protein